jgi:hypothetical protein
MARKQRTDADRRVRQCERLGRLLQMLHLIMGKGRWDANTLSAELGCSKRTVYRLLQTLSMAGVPWHFDEACRSYRVRSGYKFPALEASHDPIPNGKQVEPAIARVLADGDVFLRSLQDLLAAIRNSTSEK